VSSPEYFTRQGGSNALFVFGLYRDLLFRAPLNFESSFAINQLNTGSTPLQVAASITSSQEYEKDYLTNLFQLYLHRLPTAAEISQYVGTPATGRNDLAFIGTILGSDEYYALFAG